MQEDFKLNVARGKSLKTRILNEPGMFSGEFMMDIEIELGKTP